MGENGGDREGEMFSRTCKKRRGGKCKKQRTLGGLEGKGR